MNDCSAATRKMVLTFRNNVLWVLSWSVDLAIGMNGWIMTAEDRDDFSQFSLTALRFLCACPLMHSDALRGSDALERLQLTRASPYRDYQLYLSQIFAAVGMPVTLACLLQALPRVALELLPNVLETVTIRLSNSTEEQLTLMEKEVGPVASPLIQVLLSGVSRLRLLELVIRWCESETRAYIGIKTSRPHFTYLLLAIDGQLVAFQAKAPVNRPFKITLLRGPHVQGILSTQVYAFKPASSISRIVFRGLPESQDLTSSTTAEGLHETTVTYGDRSATLARLVRAGFVAAQEVSLGQVHFTSFGYDSEDDH
ncbi:hypothetical protein QFC21_004050 [Naganishia friedmannii]|uniref:Uncharacterized protein n=1 Tax=Naganishia friedmannii TaxID=89922 RepID=A0ACC2VJB0_9TREE|nr:hypothetical protein QFC21_004050 [Naganishia friedmannii]